MRKQQHWSGFEGLPNFEYLEKRVIELNALENEELKIIGEAGKSKKEEVDFQEVKALHKKHHVD